MDKYDGMEDAVNNLAELIDSSKCDEWTHIPGQGKELHTVSYHSLLESYEKERSRRLKDRR